MKDKPDESPAAGSRPAQYDAPAQSPDRGGGYFEIRVSGQLDDTWSEWLDGLEMQRLENGDMTLCGFILDQAALLGILNKLSHLNLALLSVREVRPRGTLKAKRSSGGNRIHE